jgi:predicted RNA-binding Zn-ribbon protein involved in translation (DUF1610 family)
MSEEQTSVDSMCMVCGTHRIVYLIPGVVSIAFTCDNCGTELVYDTDLKRTLFADDV